MNALIKKITQKPERRNLSSKFIENSLKNYAEKYNITLEKLSPKEEKIVLKEIRASLRTLVGQYQKISKSRIFLLKENNFQELLKTHRSTEERILFYPKLKKLLSSLKISSILDLACGLNPIALASPKITYYASDINESELSLINEFFKKHKIKGKTFIFDIRTLSQKSKLPKTDLTLILKTLDLLHPKQKLADNLLSIINSKYFLISFPTKKLSGAPMKHKRRPWLERILLQKNLKFRTFSSENEIFYLITTQQ